MTDNMPTGESDLSQYGFKVAYLEPECVDTELTVADLNYQF